MRKSCRNHSGLFCALKLADPKKCRNACLPIISATNLFNKPYLTGDSASFIGLELVRRVSNCQPEVGDENARSTDDQTS
jgi:hypothetical protein